MAAKPLKKCETDAERRENYPQLCGIADYFERTGRPEKVLAAVLWIIRRRQQEREAAADGENE